MNKNYIFFISLCSILLMYNEDLPDIFIYGDLYITNTVEGTNLHSNNLYCNTDTVNVDSLICQGNNIVIGNLAIPTIIQIKNLNNIGTGDGFLMIDPESGLVYYGIPDSPTPPPDSITIQTLYTNSILPQNDTLHINTISGTTTINSTKNSISFYAKTIKFFGNIETPGIFNNITLNFDFNSNDPMTIHEFHTKNFIFTDTSLPNILTSDILNFKDTVTINNNTTIGYIEDERDSTISFNGPTRIGTFNETDSFDILPALAIGTPSVPLKKVSGIKNINLADKYTYKYLVIDDNNRIYFNNTSSIISDNTLTQNSIKVSTIGTNSPEASIIIDSPLNIRCKELNINKLTGGIKINIPGSLLNTNFNTGTIFSMQSYNTNNKVNFYNSNENSKIEITSALIGHPNQKLFLETDTLIFPNIVETIYDPSKNDYFYLTIAKNYFFYSIINGIPINNNEQNSLYTIKNPNIIDFSNLKFNIKNKIDLLEKKFLNKIKKQNKINEKNIILNKIKKKLEDILTYLKNTGEINEA